MKVLVIGGTSFVGRAISWSAWHHGHDVTVFNRGVTESDLPEAIERLKGDRRSELSSLDERSFDATIDVTAYRPSDVERLAQALGQRGGHYVQISSISAYSDPPQPGATESVATLWPSDDVDPDGPITNESYGPLKAAAERSGAELFGDSAAFVRPTYVIGGFDASLRFPYWVERLRCGGEVAVPSPSDVAMQFIDARDLANFVVRVVEDELTGAFHVAGPTPPYSFRDMLDQIAAHIAPPGATLHEVTVGRAERIGGKFPLWSPTSENVLALDSSLARSKGLDLRPLEDSVDDVAEWWGERAWPEHWLTTDDEARLLSK